MTTTPIRPIARSAYDELSEPLREQVDLMARRVATGANWKVRKKTLLDILIALETLAAMPPQAREAVFRRLEEAQGTVPAEAPAEAEAEAEAAEPRDEDAGDVEREEPPPEALVLLYAGAILERLGEERIASPEQAAMYTLSIHPEHGESVIDWMKADARNAKALKKIMRGDRAFRALQRELDAAVSLAAEGEPED